MEQLAMVGGIAALVLFSIGIICIAFAERGPVDTDLDGSGRPLPGLRPEEAERPAFLVRNEDRRPTIDRLKIPTADWETASAREFWEAMKATEDAKHKG